MRSFEILSVIFNVLFLGWLIFARNKPQQGLLVGFGISILFMVTHGLVEGLRWPMIPVYLMTLFPVVSVALRHIFKPKGQKQNAPRRIRILQAAWIWNTLACSVIPSVELLRFKC